MNISNIKININNNYKTNYGQSFNGLFNEPVRDVFVKSTNGENSKIDFDKKIKRATMGKYQKELLDILDAPEIKNEILKQVNNGEVSKQDVLRILKDLSTSTFKIALDRPDDFINHSLDHNYIIYRAENHEKTGDSIARGYIQQLFKDNFIKIFNALKTIDTDTLNQMLDKRSNNFCYLIDDLSRLDKEHLEKLSELIKKVQQGRANDKIKLCQIVSIFQERKIDMSKLDNVLKDGKVSTADVNLVFNDLVTELLPNKEQNEKQNRIAFAKPIFNEEYMYLLFKTNVFQRDGFVEGNSQEFNSIVRCLLNNEDFMEFIQDENNFIGKVNAQTKEIFKQHDLSYDKWLKTEIPPQIFKSNGETLRAQLWDRNPAEDLFIGNKTRCCTAMVIGSNSAAMPIFLTNTAFNYIEIKDENNKTKGMARIYFSNIENKEAIIIDSIELTDKHFLNEAERKNIRDNIFEYVKKFASSVSGKNPDVYYIEQDAKVPINDLKSAGIKMTFLGQITNDKIYTNDSSYKWSDIREEKYVFLCKAA